MIQIMNHVNEGFNQMDRNKMPTNDEFKILVE